jgi:hypothetical protein
MIVETKLSDVVEQYQINEAWHVGRRVLIDDDGATSEIDTQLFPTMERCILFQHASGRQVFVDPAILRPFPSEKIEEPK